MLINSDFQATAISVTFGWDIRHMLSVWIGLFFCSLTNCFILFNGSGRITSVRINPKARLPTSSFKLEPGSAGLPCRTAPMSAQDLTESCLERACHQKILNFPGRKPHCM